MLESAPGQTVPLTEVDGVLRVGGTRVTLDTIVAAFEEGATPEEIAQQYPSLNLADVYAVIGYYWQNQSAIQQYLSERQADGIRRQNEARFNPQGVRERLWARRADKA